MNAEQIEATLRLLRARKAALLPAQEAAAEQLHRIQGALDDYDHLCAELEAVLTEATAHAAD